MLTFQKQNKLIKKTLLLAFVAVISLFGSAVALAATAGDPCNTPGATSGGLTCECPSSRGCIWSTTSTSSTSTDSCSDTTGGSGQVNQSKVQSCITQSPVVKDIQTIVDWLSAGVGIVVTAVIIVGGIQYSLAGDNANAVSAAKQRMINGVIALFIFLFSFAFLQWLIPGGIFK